MHLMNEEYKLKCHEMAKTLMRDFRIFEHVIKRNRDDETRIEEYANYYRQAFDLFYRQGEQPGMQL